MNGALYCLIAAVTGCACVYSCIYRTKMREQYGLEGSPAGDFCANWCCEPCALTQQYRELQNRGFDVALGITDHYLYDLKIWLSHFFDNTTFVIDTICSLDLDSLADQ